MEHPEAVRSSILQDKVCDACKLIDFNAAFDLPVDPDGDSPWDYAGIPLAKFGNDRPFDARNCSVCQLLLDAPFWTDRGQQPGADADRELRAFSLYHLSNPFPGPGSDITRWQGTAEPSLVMVREGRTVTARDNELRGQILHRGHLACVKTPDLGKPGKPRPVSRGFDSQEARRWMDVCRAGHGEDCNRSRPLRGFRLVDCATLTVVDAKESMSWTTLSYVWAIAEEVYPNHATYAETVPHRQRLPGKLPGVVLDAIEVTKQLGYNYIWVDRYCIRQGDKKDVEEQIAKMDKIYQGSDVTIVSATRQNGLPGVGRIRRTQRRVARVTAGVTLFGTPPSITRAKVTSPWAFRGWTYQEGVLSRRRLFFTEEEVLFECSEPMSYWESMCELSPAPKTETEIAFYRSSWHSSPLESALAQFYRHISDFSRRRLTYDADTLSAISGVMSTFQAGSPARQPHNAVLTPVWGIASSTTQIRDWTDVNKQVLTLGLCWFHHSVKAREPRRKKRFPSWTWAGWDGMVSWPLAHEAGLHDFAVLSEVLEVTALPSQRTNVTQTGVYSGAIKILARCLPRDRFEFTLKGWGAGRLLVSGHTFQFRGEDPWGLSSAQFVAGLEEGKFIAVLLGGQCWSSMWPKKGLCQFFDLHVLVLTEVAAGTGNDAGAANRVEFLRFRLDCRNAEGEGTAFGVSSLPGISDLPLEELVIV